MSLNSTFQSSFSDEMGGNVLSSDAYDALRLIPPPPPPPSGTRTGVGISQLLPPATNYPYQSPGSIYVTTPAAKTGTSIKLNDILQNSVGLASQIISAFGRNPNQQILTGSGSLVPITQQPQNQNSYGTGGQLSPPELAAHDAEQAEIARKKGLGTGAVDTAKGFVEEIAKSFGISSTMLLVGVGVGWYLLQKEPKKRR